MSDTKARRVNVVDGDYVGEVIQDDPSGTHMLVPVEVWLELEKELVAEQEFRKTGEWVPMDVHKIRAAWEKIKYYTRGNSNPDNHRAAAVVEGVLAELGIVRCEGCGGECSITKFDAEGVATHQEACLDCNGDGFKIGGGDE